jgi:hypothetical protein
VKGLRQRLANWLLKDVHLRDVHFGDKSIILSPFGVGDVARWSGPQPAAAQMDLGMGADGRPSVFVSGGVHACSDPNIALYTPGISGNWDSPAPTTVQAALDSAAKRILARNGDNWRGRRNATPQSLRELPQTATSFYAAGSPRDIAIISPSGGIPMHPAGTYVAVVDSAVVGQPIIVLDRVTGAVQANLPLAPLALGAGWRYITYVGGQRYGFSDKVMITQIAGGNITVLAIDLPSGAVFGTSFVMLGTGASHPYYDGAGFYFVASDGSLQGVNEPSNASAAGIHTLQPAGTFDAASAYMTSDDQFLYIPQPTSNRIARVGPDYVSPGAPVAFFTDFGGNPTPNPVGIVYDGRFLWVSLSNAASPELIQIDPTTSTLRTIRSQQAGNAGNGQGAVAFDGDSLWVALTAVTNPVQSGISRVDPERSYTVGAGEAGRVNGFNAATELAVRGTPAGSWLYVLSTGDNSVRIVKNEPFSA